MSLNTEPEPSLGRHWLLKFCVATALLFLCSFQLLSNIVSRFTVNSICEFKLVDFFLSFPISFILLPLLYAYPILLSQQLKVRDEQYLSATTVKPNIQQDTNYIFLLVVLPLFLIWHFLQSAIAPEIFESIRLLFYSCLLLIYPIHLHLCLNYGKNKGGLLVCLTLLFLNLPCFLFSPLIYQRQIWNILLLGAGLVSLILYELAYWPNSDRSWAASLNRYNPFAHFRENRILNSRISTKRILWLSNASFLAIIFLIVYAYIFIPSIKNFPLYSYQYQQVLELIKANKIQPYGAINPNKFTFPLPCEYQYLTFRTRSVVVEKTNDSLVVEFIIFSIGFGDGYTAFVYRSEPPSYLQKDALVGGIPAQYRRLQEHWFWEKWIS